MSVLQLFRRRDEIILQEEDIAEPDIRPMTELEAFASATRRIVGGLEAQIEDLDAEITRKIAQLNDLKRIRESQSLALRYLEGEI